VYVEPFCGSAAVLFAKPPATHEILNDTDGHVINFLRILRDRPDELERVCRLTPYARDEYAAADLDEPGLDDLERARRWWVRSSQSFGKATKRGTACSTSSQRGFNNVRSVWNRLDRFTVAAERLGPVVIEHDDALAVIERYSAPDAAIYCDPPYLDATRTSYAGGRRPRGDYSHEFASGADHRRLADALHATPAAVLVSGYPSTLYDTELYADWSRLERQVTCRTSNGARGPNTHATEVIWSNRPLGDGRLPLDDAAGVEWL
jgi:DNA adenine methylase